MFCPAVRYPELDRYSQERNLYRVGDRERYHLRQSELYTLAEAGKFRAITLEDLEKYVYSGNRHLLTRDLANLQRQGLIQRRSARYPRPIRVVTLTRRGKRLMRELLPESQQELYSGLKKIRELRHDTALYDVYQAKAQEIEEAGGRIKRVVLDEELKRKVNREFQQAQRSAPLEGAFLKEEIGQRHGIPVVQGQFVVPDVRIEYEDREGNPYRVDLEYITETYRHGDLSAKARAGFSLYAPHDQTPRLHRLFDQHQIMTEILSL
ncbi:MAG: MarR family winged helix-turn-helix transcriptional regulator [Acidobacteriota bacterium]